MDNKKPVTWRELLPTIGIMTEGELKNALNYEVSTTNRKTIVVRLHQRYTKVRMFRERLSIRKGELL
jgi:hypothetical protein